MAFEFKFPKSKEEMEAIRKQLILELPDDCLDGVSGGNDDVKGQSSEAYICCFCGAVVQCKQEQDMAKHIVQDCPNNPYK